MELKSIITMANRKVLTQFNLMERSLRSTGCKLPLGVIPYNNQLFELPDNAYWMHNTELFQWLERSNAYSMCRKYACLLEENYLHVDTDIMFLRDPSIPLEKSDGFISFCGHWNNPNQTVSPDSLNYHKMRSTTWQKSCFNAGQFACDQKVFSHLNDMISFTETHPAKAPLLYDTKKWKDQNGLNLIINLRGVPVTNLTLPPHCLESSWAGDYEAPGFEYRYWSQTERMPFLIHWAGCSFGDDLAINDLAKAHLSKTEWNQILRERPRSRRSLKNRLRVALKAFAKEFKN